MIVTHYLLFLFICTATLFQLISINLFSHIHSIQYCLTPVQFLSLFTVFTLLMVFADTETLIPLKSPAYFCNVCNLLHNHTALLVCILFIYLYYVIYNGKLLLVYSVLLIYVNFLHFFLKLSIIYLICWVFPQTFAKVTIQSA